MGKEYIDLLVIIPLEDELSAVKAVFEHDTDLSTDTQFRWKFKSGVEGVSMLVVQQEEMGRLSAARATYSLLDEYDVGLVVCLGIAGSLSSDARLGDVCYTGHVIDVYDNAKAIDTATGIEVEFSPKSYSTEKEITTAINFMRTQPPLMPLYERWQVERGTEAKRLVPDSVRGRKLGQQETLGNPKSKDGTIVCAMVSNAKNYNDRLRALDRKVLAIDTESGAVFAYSQERHVKALTIRGISDYARDKEELEDESSGTIRELAAGNAASFLKLQLQNDRFLRLLQKYRSQMSLDFAPPTEMGESTACLSEVLGRLDREISVRLNELSPEYRLQEKGYRLPIPRIRAFEEGSGLVPEALPQRVEIRDAIKAHRTVLLSLPKTYPDQSLAWIIADDLLTAEIDGKQAIPLPLDGATLRPPSHGIWSEASVSELGLAAIGNIEPVFIIDNIPLESKSRIKFIQDQVSSNPTARFVFVDRTGVNMVRENEFISSTAAVPYSICDVSFVEIAHFVQKNFSMSGSEAEVIAYRLKETFEQFDLSTHPTYFAGIPRETLAALLQANRRSELIQLAVDGFLTFVVADDPADITLSRTTRSRFLRKLAVQLRLEKRTFTHEEIIAFTKEFSDLHDFDIDPIQFIQAFIDKGLLHFEGERIKISLPFIEFYLLAVELAANPILARTYFDLDDMEFDHSTFDIYCEIGASPDIVDDVLARIEGLVKEAPKYGEGVSHVLLGPDVNPALLSRPGRMTVMQNRITTAIAAVKEQRTASNEKQRLLDATERVREETSKRADEGIDDDVFEEKAKVVNGIGHIWAIGTTLLGSGAEHLNAGVKRRLASALVAAGSHLIDMWTRLIMMPDYGALKEQLQSGGVRDALVEMGYGDDEARQLIDILVDAFEYKHLADPLLRVLYHLYEGARHKVLSASIAKVGTANPMEALIHTSWLADIDMIKGRVPARDAIRNLPNAPFLRATMVTHYLTRAYWNHSEPNVRLALLDFADEIIKPTNRTIDKGKLKRVFGADPPPEDPLEKPIERDDNM